MPRNLATKYAEAMREHPHGYALYVPESMDILKPGACGYLNDLGRWQPIIGNIADATSFQSGTFSAPGSIIPMSSRKHEWGPKISSTVSHTKTAIDAGTSALPAGFPVGASIVLDFQTSRDFGSILHCTKLVSEEGYFHRTPFLQWAKANAAAILKAQPDVRSQGMWVVTGVYATEDIWINAWTERERHVTMGFTVAVQPVGEIGPSGEFLRGSAVGGGWNHFTPDKKDDKLVVFFSGLHLRYRWLPFGKPSVHEVRGDSGEEPIIVTDPLDEENVFQLEWEHVGPEPTLLDTM